MKKRPRDINQLAASIVGEATGDKPTEPETPIKNPAAVALGRLGGLKGGNARAENLSKKRRKEIAQKAGNGEERPAHSRLRGNGKSPLA